MQITTQLLKSPALKAAGMALFAAVAVGAVMGTSGQQPTDAAQAGAVRSLTSTTPGPASAGQPSAAETERIPPPVVPVTRDLRRPAAGRPLLPPGLLAASSPQSTRPATRPILVADSPVLRDDRTNPTTANRPPPVQPPASIRAPDVPRIPGWFEDGSAVDLQPGRPDNSDAGQHSPGSLRDRISQLTPEQLDRLGVTPEELERILNEQRRDPHWVDKVNNWAAGWLDEINIFASWIGFPTLEHTGGPGQINRDAQFIKEVIVAVGIEKATNSALDAAPGIWGKFKNWFKDKDPVGAVFKPFDNEIGAIGLDLIPTGTLGKEAIEAATRQRLEQQIGRRIRDSADEAVDYVDDLGRTYDQMGNPNMIPHWDKQKEQFFRQIDRHLGKADVTVIDLTNFPQHIKDQVADYVKELSEESFDKIIPIGF